MEDNVVMKTLSKQFHIYIKYLRSDYEMLRDFWDQFAQI